MAVIKVSVRFVLFVGIDPTRSGLDSHTLDTRTAFDVYLNIQKPIVASSF